MEKQLNSKEIYDGKVIRVSLDDVSLDDGREAKREVVHHRGGCCIALKGYDGKYLLTKQYRYAQGEEMIEFCAGKIEEGEDVKETILRESVEELGYTVKNLKYSGFIAPSCGYTTERIHLFQGEADLKVGTHFDEDENITTLYYSLEELEEMIRQGIIYDAKTIALVYRLTRG